ncbi:MAG: contractile injection system protein, VgrG/Pvc8 family, partial [Pseudomonadota bacterium]
MYIDREPFARLLSEIGLSTANRALRLRLACPEGFRDDLLLPQRVYGKEAVFEGLEYRVQCLSADAKIPLKSLVGVAAEIQLVTDQGELHCICGIVTEVSAGQCDGGLATYQIVLRDMLAVMDLDTNMRVFLDKNELDIVKIILNEWRLKDPILASAFEFEISIDLSAYSTQSGHPFHAKLATQS